MVMCDGGVFSTQFLYSSSLLCKSVLQMAPLSSYLPEMVNDEAVCTFCLLREKASECDSEANLVMYH